MNNYTFTPEKVLKISEQVVYFSELCAFFGLSSQQMKIFCFRNKILDQVRLNIRNNLTRAKEKTYNKRKETQKLKARHKRNISMSEIELIVSEELKERLRVRKLIEEKYKLHIDLSIPV